MAGQAGTITTQIPSQLDRLPWSRFHWRVVIGLGGVWILETIAHAVEDHDAMSLRELHRAVGARYWGPGEFRKAMREALAEKRIVRTRRGRVRAAHGSDGPPR